MPASVILGTQWGDEGKGKITDLYSESADMVVRYQGGNNAGHTIVVDGERFRPQPHPLRRALPDGHPGDRQRSRDRSRGAARRDGRAHRTRHRSRTRLRVSGNAHVIMPYHKKMDMVLERFLGDQQIGTTKRGIGPAYLDKYSRFGIRTQDLFDPKIFREKLEVNLKDKNRQLQKVYNQLPLDFDPIYEEYLGYADRLQDYVTDTSLLVWEAIRDEKNVLFEGAQGTLLDIDHGTYPVRHLVEPHRRREPPPGRESGPRDIDNVIGVAKAYITRVGTGPFPTELHDEIGDRMIEIGGEYGVVTGTTAPYRLARCGRPQVRDQGERAQPRSPSPSSMSCRTSTRSRSPSPTTHWASVMTSTSPASSGCCTTAPRSTKSTRAGRSDISEVREYHDLPKAAQQLRGARRGARRGSHHLGRCRPRP